MHVIKYILKPNTQNGQEEVHVMNEMTEGLFPVSHIY